MYTVPTFALFWDCSLHIEKQKKKELTLRIIEMATEFQTETLFREAYLQKII